MQSPGQLRRFHHRDFDPERLVTAKRGQTISVCLPARDEEATVGPIVHTIVSELVDRTPLVDEVVVIDDHSTDRTAEIAAAAGARVVAAADLLPAYGRGHGKGEALWKSLLAADGDLIVWCDADIVGFTNRFVLGVVGPLLTVPEIDFVKGFYDRPVAGGDRGGRVTELVARPLLSMLFPQLADLVQPLAGEYGGRRELLEQLPFVEGYGVDIALLIDIASRFGTGVLAQADLGERVHRNRPLDELSPQATSVMQAALHRADPGLVPLATKLRRVDGDPIDVAHRERPPMVDVAEYARRLARGA